MTPGPLAGLRVIEMDGIGPVPFCAMLLADMGADVVRIVRQPRDSGAADVTGRGRRMLAMDLQAAGASQALLALVGKADILLEGFRPGVMERLGLGPQACLAARPSLVYGRMTGWGQEGPLARAAGHDINYIAISGALHAIGAPDGNPLPPLNYVGDYGGGAMLLLAGVLSALHHARACGRGQVVDAAMSDGAALLSSLMYGMSASGRWRDGRGVNLLDGGAHFYTTYRCRDGKFIAIGAIEPKFYETLLRLCGIEDPAFAAQTSQDAWPDLKQRFAAVFAARDRQDWCDLLEGTDACFSPVLDWQEAPAHPHNVARGTFFARQGVVQPAPAPRFSVTPTQPAPLARQANLDELRQAWGADAAPATA